MVCTFVDFQRFPNFLLLKVPFCWIGTIFFWVIMTLFSRYLVRLHLLFLKISVCLVHRAETRRAESSVSVGFSNVELIEIMISQLLILTWTPFKITWIFDAPTYTLLAFKGNLGLSRNHFVIELMIFTLIDVEQDTQLPPGCFPTSNLVKHPSKDESIIFGKNFETFNVSKFIIFLTVCKILLLTLSDKFSNFERKLFGMVVKTTFYVYRGAFWRSFFWKKCEIFYLFLVF